MGRKKDYSWFHKNIEELHTQTDKILKSREKSKPKIIAFRIVGVYLFISIFWVAFSDKIFSLLIQNEELYKTIQLYKDWLFIIVSSIVFYLVIYHRIDIFTKVLDRLLVIYEELVAAHEELMAMEEELSTQYDELLKNKNLLEKSNQRYELVVNGANDGIWDLDFKENTFFFSLYSKENFGYEEGDLDFTVETFNNLIHPEDFPKVSKTITDYYKSKEGFFSSSYRLRAKNGSYRYIMARGAAIWDEYGDPIRVAGSHTDITDQRLMEDKLYQLAYHDTLTSLPRMSYLRTLDLFNEDKNFWILYFDIDDFRHINETMGHVIGDKLIIHIGNILKKHAKDPNVVARLSGDEFAVILLNINREQMIEKLNNILADIRKPWEINDHSFFATVSIGIVSYPEHGDNLNDLMQNADIALSNVKDGGKNNYSIYSQSMKDKAWKFVEMDADLRAALRNSEFTLHYQPLYDVKTNKLIAAEALIRWYHPKKGYIPPLEFIPFSEKVGYIREITGWVFETACKQKQIWTTKGYEPITISINLSGEMFGFQGLIGRANELLNEYNIEKNGIEVEITETAIISDFENSIEVLNQLRNLDFTIALDDFGTGYSSLTYLKDLPIDIIKIDRKFINGIGISKKDDSILKYIIQLAHTLDLKVVAEGVETEEQFIFLKENNCDIAQGYYFAKPMPAEELEKLLD